jgi:hypothetical protein
VTPAAPATGLAEQNSDAVAVGIVAGHFPTAQTVAVAIATAEHHRHLGPGYYFLESAIRVLCQAYYFNLF